MIGWFSVISIAFILISLSVISVRATAMRWWDYPVVAALAVALGQPLYRLVAGDLSRSLPQQIWSDGADGKDQIIVASIAATLLLPLICAALIWLAIKVVWRNVRA